MLAKYLAAACIMLITVLLTNVYTLVIALGGTVYAGEWFVGYTGFLLQSLSFLALDLFVTCFAKNQMTGALAAFGAPISCCGWLICWQPVLPWTGWRTRSTF